MVVASETGWERAGCVGSMLDMSEQRIWGNKAGTKKGMEK